MTGRPAVEHDRRPGRLWQAPARRFDSGGSGRLCDPHLAWFV